MEWISVKDRLPDKEQECLVIANRITGYISGTHNVYDVYKVIFNSVDYSSLAESDYYEIYASEITHWMPLPKLPKNN